MEKCPGGRKTDLTDAMDLYVLIYDSCFTMANTLLAHNHAALSSLSLSRERRVSHHHDNLFTTQF